MPRTGTYFTWIADTYLTITSAYQGPGIMSAAVTSTVGASPGSTLGTVLIITQGSVVTSLVGM